MKRYGFQVENGASLGRVFIHAARPAPGGEFNVQERWLTREEAFDFACALIHGAQKLERGVTNGSAIEETRAAEGSGENQEDDPLATGTLGGDQGGGSGG